MKYEKEKRIRSFAVMFEAIEKMGNFYDIITGRYGVNNKASFGSTNPKLVREAIAREERWLRSLKFDKDGNLEARAFRD